jgi:hypothetical protein
MEKFNLDITTYSNDDICGLLSLPNDYDMNIVKIAKDKLQKKLVKLENQDMFKIQEILLFLDNAQNKLFQNLSNNQFSGTYAIFWYL